MTGDLARHGFTLLIAVAVIVPVPLFATAQDCTPQDLSARLQSSDTAYDHALELSQDLERGGFVIRCVLRSHLGGLFEDLVGAALYRTNRGDFEALFRAAPDTFDQLIVNERREGDRWVYSFDGQPRPWPANRMEGRRIQFVKDAHRLLLVWDDEALAATLRQALAGAGARR